MKSQQSLTKAPLPTPLQLADVNTEDGPQPMRACKPAAKNLNAADQFTAEQFEEDSKRAATPTPIDVQEHNKIPRLEENLNKMGALSKVKSSATVVAKQSSEHHEHRRKSSDNVCHRCRKLRIMDRMKRHNANRSHSRSTTSELRSRVTKSNGRQKSILMSQVSKSRFCLNKKSNKCRCRYCMRVTNKGTCTNLALKEASTLTVLVFENKDGVPRHTDGSNTPNGSFKSDRTSLQSGSLNSNLSHMSLEHEPMVTNED